MIATLGFWECTMENKKIVLISALVVALAALATLGHIVAVYPNPDVLHHIDAQVLIACLGAVSAILLRPVIRDRRQRWRKNAPRHQRRAGKVVRDRNTMYTENTAQVTHSQKAKLR